MFSTLEFVGFVQSPLFQHDYSSPKYIFLFSHPVCEIDGVSLH